MRLSYEACPEDSLVGSESCIAAKERELTDCIFYCHLDTTCISECNRDHINQIEKCPCYDDCYNGCPCEYESDYCDSGMCSFYQPRVFKQPSAKPTLVQFERLLQDRLPLRSLRAHPVDCITYDGK